MVAELDVRLIKLIGSIDDGKITNVTRLNKERQDLLVSCDSEGYYLFDQTFSKSLSRKHLIRFEEKHISLLHQKWGYEMMHSGGVPYPEVEAFVKPEKDLPECCMVLSWIDAIPAVELIHREGRNEKSMKLCHKLGEVLCSLHSIQIAGPIQDYVRAVEQASPHEENGVPQGLAALEAYLADVEDATKDFKDVGEWFCWATFERLSARWCCATWLRRAADVFQGEARDRIIAAANYYERAFQLYEQYRQEVQKPDNRSPERIAVTVPILKKAIDKERAGLEEIQKVLAIEPKLVTRKAFTVMGVNEKFERGKEDFEGIWKRFMNYDDVIDPHRSNDGHYGVSWSDVDYTAGRAIEKSPANIPAGVVVQEVPKATFAVFGCTVGTIGETWHKIMVEWLPSSDYIADESAPFFEYYTPRCKNSDHPVFHYVAVKEKP